MHTLLTAEAGQRLLLLGNEAIARGAVEAGVAVAATYPGTPSSEISRHLFEIARHSEMTFEYSTNEKVAFEVAAAAANSGVRSLAIMKHVGLNVAADALMTLAYVGVRAGMVIISADDPNLFSSQNEQDNRLLARFAGLPMLEPSSVAEAREMMVEAFEISERLHQPVLLRTTTRINHSTAAVTLGRVRPPVTDGHFAKDPFNFVCVPAVSYRLHGRLLETLEAGRCLAEDSPRNTETGKGELGVVCSGISHAYVSDAIADLGLGGRVRVLRLGFSHPLPTDRLIAFLRACRKVLVVEEGEPYLEEALKVAAHDAGLTLSIRGKAPDLFSRLYEYDPGLVRTVMARCFEVAYAPRAPLDLSDRPELPPRPPTLCAGCSHRATYYVVKQAAEGLDVVYPSDIGCYTLGLQPPLSMTDYVICMGASTGSACGFATATDQRVVAFIGDSTFFHSGIPGLINAVFNNRRLTLVILDNGTTAMTGHQPHPGADMQQLKLDGYGRLSIESVVRGLGVEHVSVIKPLKVNKSIAAVRDALAHPGVSVVIAQELCALFARGLKIPRRRPFRVGERCVDHRDCISRLGCPAFYLKDGRVHIDADICTGCALCAQVCPENAILPVPRAAAGA